LEPIQEFVTQRSALERRSKDIPRGGRAYAFSLYHLREIGTLLEKPLQRFSMFGPKSAYKIIGIK